MIISTDSYISKGRRGFAEISLPGAGGYLIRRVYSVQGIVSLPRPIDRSSRVKNEIRYKRRETLNPLFSLPESVRCVSSEGLASNTYLIA